MLVKKQKYSNKIKKNKDLFRKMSNSKMFSRKERVKRQEKIKNNIKIKEIVQVNKIVRRYIRMLKLNKKEENFEYLNFETKKREILEKEGEMSINKDLSKKMKIKQN